MDKVSYALGLSIGNNFQNSGINNLVVEDFIDGLKAVLSGGKPAISYDEAKQVIDEFFVKLQKESFEERRRKTSVCDGQGKVPLSWYFN